MLRLTFLLLTILSCENIKEVAPIKKQEGPRYKVSNIEPPVIFSNARSIKNSRGNPLFLWIVDNKGEFYANKPREIFKMIKPYMPFENGFPGYGLSNKLFKSNENPNKHIEKTSMTWSIEDDDLAIDYFYHNQREKKVEAFLSHYFVECQYKIKEGFSCRKSKDGHHSPSEWYTIWNSKEDPVVEMSTHNYYGIYAITETGKLIAVKYEGSEGITHEFIHKDLTFRKSSNNRYFINSPSNYLCVQTIDKNVYCSEQNLLEYDSTDYGLVNKQYPSLAKVTTLDFFVKEVAFGGRHFCFLSEEGDVYCQGDNGCGQITARHDGEQYVKELTKVNFLNEKVKSITAHASGNCALLVNSDVQCWGLGASVIREKLWDDYAYLKSFDWPSGYRPWQVCLGGAENGI